MQNPPCPQLCQEESGQQSQEATSLWTGHNDDGDDDGNVDGDDDGDVDGDDQKGKEDEDVDEKDHRPGRAARSPRREMMIQGAAVDKDSCSEKKNFDEPNFTNKKI